VDKYWFELRRRRFRKSSLEVSDSNVRGAAIACTLSRLSQRVHRFRIAAGMSRQEVNGNPIRCRSRTREQTCDALVVSSDVVGDAATAHPYVLAVEDGRVARRSVRLGIRGEGSTEIADGIADGAELIIPDGRRLAPGVRVRVERE
jgi:hypothetical protein